MTDYAMTKALDAGYDETVEKVKAELKEEGFGVLTHIDVKATLKREARRRLPALRDPRRLQPAAGAQGAQCPSRCRHDVAL